MRGHHCVDDGKACKKIKRMKSNGKAIKYCKQHKIWCDEHDVAYTQSQGCTRCRALSDRIEREQRAARRSSGYFVSGSKLPGGLASFKENQENSCPSFRQLSNKEKLSGGSLKHATGLSLQSGA
jgi:hypothetical protein